MPLDLELRHALRTFLPGGISRVQNYYFFKKRNSFFASFQTDFWTQTRKHCNFSTQTSGKIGVKIRCTAKSSWGGCGGCGSSGDHGMRVSKGCYVSQEMFVRCQNNNNPHLMSPLPYLNIDTILRAGLQNVLWPVERVNYYSGWQLYIFQYMANFTCPALPNCFESSMAAISAYHGLQ